uniref:trifunctional transcriptional regulator/proline dehydrogenase/L-glutamate gamma-semialdehyde dehydrogenase n=1 Tax=Martelella alba TaxID=2590451 RepID=UPI001E396806|nr:trifunctional transcriptional regulator/proline dehydrogenase/L-glutamate gamma-semialdehyde dehydrogenase [Martelella alba]
MESEPDNEPAAVADDIPPPPRQTPVFRDFADALLPISPLREATLAAWRAPETALIPALLAQGRLTPAQNAAIASLAARLSAALRSADGRSARTGIAQRLLQEYALSSREGTALMCLAEALLRIPDNATRDALIRDKLSRGRWQVHRGHSPSLFVNAATWGLLLGDRILSAQEKPGLARTLSRVVARGGEPLIRQAMAAAMRLMGAEFVAGEDIAAALRHARRLETRGFRYSYDMLGEAALTDDDALAYLAAYRRAIEAIGAAAAGRGIYGGPGISIKLSALHPRYCRAQYTRVMTELYPRLVELTVLARRYDIGINIDAEETDRLTISLDLLTRLCFEPALQGWDGIGFVIQAYQKRCPQVIDELADLAGRSGHRLMVRLVKGAYWDSEIKRAQIEGAVDYPVYTRKIHTDIAYLACARRLLAQPALFYPQFATHNARTLAAIYQVAGPERYSPGQYEFQCLHGMGEALYAQVVGQTAQGGLDRPCRVYAPVGGHGTLLAYLVRRLLENGANSSFVHRIADPALPLETLLADPAAQAVNQAGGDGVVGRPHRAIALPRHLYGAKRLNAAGLDLADELCLRRLAEALTGDAAFERAEPLVAGRWCATEANTADTVFGETPVADAMTSASNAVDWRPIHNPAASRDQVGVCRDADMPDVRLALDYAGRHAADWAACPAGERAEVLNRAADSLEAQMPAFIGLLVREAGKTLAAAIGEVRETVDFLRYYASLVPHIAYGAATPLGTVVCISPWNFPLSIFLGQIAAALATGNHVLAKPAEQTPLIAARAIRVLLAAGIPPEAIQLLPGPGERVGAALAADTRVRGVMFTGSTDVARQLQKTLANRLNPDGQPVPLIAETGGLNAMLVDSSALTEQAVADIVTSAFDSAGQRCSALRLLCVQDAAADRTLAMLRGAMAEYTLGDPRRLSVDIGPVIDETARRDIETYIEAMRAAGHRVWRVNAPAGDGGGTFVAPTLIELPRVEALTREVFGPVLHVVRYRREALDDLITAINSRGYGLTFGLHSRIDAVAERVIRHARVGNCYINRNMIGAVVGVQPFGGEGMSGTGPKAGGPLYLYRLLARRPDDGLPATLTALGEGEPGCRETRAALTALIAWTETRHGAELAERFRRLGELSPSGRQWMLPGPTGEQNLYYLAPRAHIRCQADNDVDRLTQLAALAAIGAVALWAATPGERALHDALPAAVQDMIRLGAADNDSVEGALFHGDDETLTALVRRLADRPGPIIPVQAYRRGDTAIRLDGLLVERAVSINTTAAGGNTELMALE